ncbi:MAG: hypothetical protein R3B47_19545 [Bacteroidia bacterium]
MMDGEGDAPGTARNDFGCTARGGQEYHLIALSAEQIGKEFFIRTFFLYLLLEPVSKKVERISRLLAKSIKVPFKAFSCSSVRVKTLGTGKLAEKVIFEFVKGHGKMFRFSGFF